MAVVGQIVSGSKGGYRKTTEGFVDRSNHSPLDTSETNQMVVAFRKKRIRPVPNNIRGTEAEVVSSYLRVLFSNKLDWKHHMEAVYKKV